MSPSKDPINEKANAWMLDELHDYPRHYGKPLSDDAVAKHRRKKREMSAQIQRLAGRLGIDPDELASRLSEVTIRRTKYPDIEAVLEDGTRSFKHDPQIESGVRSLHR